MGCVCVCVCVGGTRYDDGSGKVLYKDFVALVENVMRQFARVHPYLRRIRTQVESSQGRRPSTPAGTDTLRRR